MKYVFVSVLTLFAMNAFAINCDCEVQVYSPMTGSHQAGPDRLKIYELEEYSSYSKANQLACKKVCLEKFQKDMPGDRLRALLLTYTQGLIAERAVGFNCTGLTTLKYPVRVKASLGKLGLGNVSDTIEIVNHEELCF
jgi:hypothetical protein